jgi:hypothetical protein
MCPIGQRARIRLLPGALQLKAELHDDLIARFVDATDTALHRGDDHGANDGPHNMKPTAGAVFRSRSPIETTSAAKRPGCSSSMPSGTIEIDRRFAARKSDWALLHHT